MDNYEELLTKHRKEKKELQGKIQALKKTATKGDKKKKKEVSDIITKLEMELDMKHSQELSSFSSDTPDDTSKLNESVNHLSLSDNEDILDEVPGLKQHRISKAQKRREKKALQVKERELRIFEQEAENVYGARTIELETIKNILKERGLMIYEIPSDGNCLYCAIDHQLKMCHGSGLGVTELRLKTSTVLRENSNEYLPFLSHPDTGEMLTQSQFYDYCDQVAHTTAWGGQVELRALSVALKCCVEVIQSEGPSMIVGEEYLKDGASKLILTYHRRMYSLGEHYNSVQPFCQDEEEKVE
ncbi:deubiquitinase OTUD6B isoform X1 [Halyomorpha halys]|uniref:deubiquitinase OTUD6B isoform X1 n=2 Tax=Halyomorpha halys TaxID=286706 RepID=UPI0006D4F354|nr:OTU domain-containing protein 6B isoform X1 [Halyomorpha halys]